MAELISQMEVDGIRTDVEQLFVDTVLVQRPGDHNALQPGGTYQSQTMTPVLEPTQAAGEWVPNCAIYPVMSRRDRFDEFGGGLIFTRQYRFNFHWYIADIQIRDRITVIASRDPQLINRIFEVRDVVLDTNIGYRRITAHDSRE